MLYVHKIFLVFACFTVHTFFNWSKILRHSILFVHINLYRILLFLIGEAIFVPFLLAIGIYAIKRNKRLTELVGSE